ncbi:LacI family DNA-binding transcriptional regulator [Paenarthrobacter sp. Z7-10]|uniref:LacI family DNA-binding transcriptional regulator n=1 Tax=Paenarthrobacter sp. Z7-10 TaxID=2787635 RepID=UPI0022A90742|nr:LacI family DNA-binding transcriptional regulator [Paenarthrobacter sp. Z7-10]MCZ2404642.1 LacI family DNA-binding transcriptional regulator [Paenarthrobacter sp. Z7-10]
MTQPAVQPLRSAVTRTDVARYAGVSAAVVSYVVNSGPRNVAPATAARVLEAIRVLGYRPNAAARALKLGSSETFGLILPENSNPLFAQLAHSVEEAADRLGFALMMANSDGSLSKERRHLRNFLSRQVTAVLLASVASEPDLSDVISADIPVVLLNQGQAAPGFAAVGVDLRQGAQEAVKHLIWHGHRNIGLVIGTNGTQKADGRELGWLDALATEGLRAGPIARAPFTREGGYAAGKRLIAGNERPTAVFASSDSQAAGLLRALHEGGIRIPEDIAIASFDGSPESEYTWPGLTTVAQPLAAMAAAAVEAVTGGGHNDNPTLRIFPTELIVRRSCGCG